jgi:hypothetical protein
MKRKKNGAYAPKDWSISMNAPRKEAVISVHFLAAHMLIHKYLSRPAGRGTTSLLSFPYKFLDLGVPA